MGRPIQADQTDVTTTIRIIDSTDGTPEQAVEHNTAGIALWYRRGATGAKTTITPAALAALTTAHTDGGIEHIDDGYYRLDIPDAAFATGVDYVQIGGTLTDMIVLGVSHPITAHDPVDGINSIPTGTAPTAGAIADAVWDEATSGHTTASTFGAQAATDIDDLVTKLTVLHDTRIPDIISLANIRTQDDNALSAIYLDQLIANAYNSASPSGSTESLLNEMTENNAGVTRFTGAALAQATGGVGTIEAIADGVWDELKAGHTTSGSFGEVLQYILSASNLGAAVWDDVRSGHTTVGSFGEALTSNEATRDAAIADAVWDESAAAHVASGSFGEQAGTDIDAILASVGSILGTSVLYQGTIASLTSQTSMTLAASFPPDDDVLIDHLAVFQDVGTTEQVDAVMITDSDGGTGVITLARAPHFTVSPTDKITILVTSTGASDTRLNAAAQAQILAYGLDHMFAAAITGTDVVDNSFGAKLVSKSATADFDDYNWVTDSLQALADTTADGAILSTTIAGVTSQSIFTLTDGPAEADALNGCIAVITDVATPTQFTVRKVTDYAVTTKIVTLDDDATFTVATTDIIKFYPARELVTEATIRAEIDSNSTELATLVADTATLKASDTAQDAQIALVKTETDKIASMIVADAATDAQIALIKTETDKIPATITKIDSILAAVNNLSGLELVDTTVSVVDSTTQFRLAAGPPDDNALISGLAVFTDASTPTQKSFRNITAYNGTTKQITVASAPDFTIVATDLVQVFAESTIADYTATLALIQTETDKIPAMITTQGTQTTSLSTISGHTTAISGNQTALLARHDTHDTDNTAIKAKTDLIGTASGTDNTDSLAAIAAVQSTANTINSTTAGHTANINRIDEIETKIDLIDTNLDLVKTETDKMPATITKIDTINTNTASMATSGVALTSAAETSLVAAIGGTAVGANNITVSVVNYGQLVANTLMLKEGQEESITFTSTIADVVPDLSAADTVILFGVKTSDKSFALRTLEGAKLVNTGLQSVRVDISETLAKDLIPGRGEFDVWALYGYNATTGAYTDAKLFASGRTKIDAVNVQLTI